MERRAAPAPGKSPYEAQLAADRIRLLRQELAAPDLQRILDLTPEHLRRFDDWALARIADLTRDFDVDANLSQKRVSWGMRIASTLGGIALCAAVVLFFMRYWGGLPTWLQVAILVAAPLLALGAAETTARREQTPYLTGLLALVAFAAFAMDLAVLGRIFNIASTERALLAWGAFALFLAYRYGLRLLLGMGLLLLVGYGAAAVTAAYDYRWFTFGDRPELVGLLALLLFCAPLAIAHRRQSGFASVYRLTGMIVFFLCVLSLAEWGVPSYLPFTRQNIERLYELAGLLTSAGAIWLGIRRQWSGMVNVAAGAFLVFLSARLYHLMWDWMPSYLFFAIVGALGIALVLIFKRVRRRLAPSGAAA